MLLKLLLSHRRIVLLLCLTLFLRLFWLDKIPIGIVHDNINFSLNAKAIFYTGKDVSGTWNPFMLTPVPDEFPQAELPYAIIAPVVGALPFSLSAIHGFYALANTLLVLFMFLIARRVFPAGQAFIIGLVAAINPWNLFFGRTAFEAPLALCLYLFAWYIIVRAASWRKLLAIIPVFLGFYTYMAYKIVLLPFTTAILWYAYSHRPRREDIRPYLLILVFCVGLLCFFIISLKNQQTSARLSELSIVPVENVTAIVNAERRFSIAPQITYVFSNKFFQAAKAATSKYLGAFSPEYLFVSNEHTPHFTIWNHGYFYYIDLIFFIIGCCVIFSKYRKFWYLCMILLLIAPVPSLLSTVNLSYSQRSSLYFPVFYFFIGSGIWYVLNLGKKRIIRIGTGIFISAVYALSLANFLHTYFFIQPVYASEGYAFSARLTATYIHQAKLNNQAVTVVLDHPKTLYKAYLLYTNAYNRTTYPAVRDNFVRKTYTDSPFVQFRSCTDIPALLPTTTYIYDPEEKCPIFPDTLKTKNIPRLADGGTVYRIAQDTICTPYNLKRYPDQISLDNLAVEKINLRQFCETYITDFSR